MWSVRSVPSIEVVEAVRDDAVKHEGGDAIPIPIPILIVTADSTLMVWM